MIQEYKRKQAAFYKRGKRYFYKRWVGCVTEAVWATSATTDWFALFSG